MPLKDLDHEQGIDHTDNTDRLSEVYNFVRYFVPRPQTWLIGLSFPFFFLKGQSVFG